MRAALEQACLCLLVGAIDLDVVFEFPLAFEARVERLVVLVVAVSVALQKAAAILRQDDRVVAIARHADGLDQPLFAEMPQVARARIGRSIVVVSEVTTGDHSKGANGRQRARFRAAQGVLAVAVANDLPLQSARQVDVPRERVARLPIALTTVAVALRPACIITPIAAVLVRGLPVVSWTAAERPRIVVIAVARSDVGLPPVVIAIAVVRGTTASRDSGCFRAARRRASRSREDRNRTCCPPSESPFTMSI